MKYSTNTGVLLAWGGRRGPGESLTELDEEEGQTLERLSTASLTRWIRRLAVGTNSVPCDGEVLAGCSLQVCDSGAVVQDDDHGNGQQHRQYRRNRASDY